MAHVGGKDWEESRPCNCKESKFCHPGVGHIVTGDLAIVQNLRLQTLLKMGPNFREAPRVDWKEVEESVCANLNGVVMKWAKLCKLDPNEWQRWTEVVIGEVKARLESIIQKLAGFNIRTQ